MNLAPVEAIVKAVLYEGYLQPAALDLRRRLSPQ